MEQDTDLNLHGDLRFTAIVAQAKKKQPRSAQIWPAGAPPGRLPAAGWAVGWALLRLIGSL